MKRPGVELALGTVQFGMKYGIVGRGEQVPAKEAKEIFARAWEYGIRVIDTAPAYGDIEAELDSLTEHYPFSMVSKIPAIPRDLDSHEVEDFVTKSIHRTSKRLGKRLSTLLFHRSEDLLVESGVYAWNAAISAIPDSTIQLGASCYSPSELPFLQEKFSLSAAQIPGNVFDQRLRENTNKNGIDLYLRSVFLQGILLQTPEEVTVKLPQAANSISAWRAWCDEKQLTPLQAALSIAKGLPGVRYCVVGVDRLSHIEDILTAWTDAVPLNGTALATDNMDIIDPRRWPIN